MMEDVNLTDLNKKYPNRFLLAVAVAKRARQLKEGATPLVELKDGEMLPIMTALEELQQGNLEIIMQEHKEDEEELIEEINQYLVTTEIEDEVVEEEEKPKKDTKSKSKSKSLAA